MQKLQQRDQIIDKFAAVVLAVLCTLIAFTHAGCAIPSRRAVAQRKPVPVQIAGPIRVEVPQQCQPPTIVNVYEDHTVDVDGPAEIRHHSNGIEVEPKTDAPLWPGPDPRFTPDSNTRSGATKTAPPSTGEAEQLGKADTLPPSVESFPPTEPLNEGTDGGWFTPTIRKWTLVGSFAGLIIVAIAAFKFRGPLATVAKDADLSDGVGDELQQLASLIGKELKEQFLGKQPVKKKRTAKKKTT